MVPVFPCSRVPVFIIINNIIISSIISIIISIIVIINIVIIVIGSKLVGTHRCRRGAQAMDKR